MSGQKEKTERKGPTASLFLQRRKCMEIVSLIGVLVGLAVFIYLAYKGYNIIFLTVLSSIIVAIFSGMNPITVLNDTWLTRFSGFIKSWFLIYALSATFAKFMGESGAARSIALKLARLARRSSNPATQKFIAIITLPIINTILTYGGVSSLVCVFIMVGIAKDLFMELDIPWHFYGMAALGSATYALGALPGAPDVLNLTPTEYLGTTPMAAPGYGILATIIMFGLACVYLKHALKKAEGETFLPTGAAIAADKNIGGQENIEYPLWRSIAPPIVLLVVMNILKQPVILAMICAIITNLILFWPQLKGILKPCIAGGIPNGVVTAAMISSTVAFGAVVAASPAYTLIVGGLDKLSWMPPAWQIFITVNVCAALTSSSTSAIGIVFGQFAERFLATGLAPAAIHRIATVTSLGLNTLPHSVGVCNAAGASKLTIGQIYKHYLWITVIFPLVAAVVLCILATLGIVF